MPTLRQISLADEIREFVENQYIIPARKEDRATVTVNTGDIHQKMGLHNRLPAVCEAIRSKKFLHSCGITLSVWSGPAQGASVNATYKFSADSLPSNPGFLQARTAKVAEPALNEIVWSPEISLESKAISGTIPHQPGIYKLLQNMKYPRYLGSTRVVKIGMSETSLQKEILNHLNIHTASNRLARITHSGVVVSAMFAVLPVEAAHHEEARLLRQFEDQHWDLPTLNSQRGYARGEDSHYRNGSRDTTLAD